MTVPGEVELFVLKKAILLQLRWELPAAAALHVGVKGHDGFWFAAGRMLDEEMTVAQLVASWRGEGRLVVVAAEAGVAATGAATPVRGRRADLTTACRADMHYQMHARLQAS